MRTRRIPSDRGLTVRIVVVAVLTPLVVLAALAAMLLIVKVTIKLALIAALVLGAVAARRARRAALARGRRLSVAEAPELHAAVERLCVLADVAKPEIVLDPRRLPNSWIEGTARGGYRLHLTQGLLDLLEPRELEAVVAHELAHVVNRDAAVMTVVGGPGEALLTGGRSMVSMGWFLAFGALIAMAIGWVGSLGTRVLSRYREFAADAGAVALTGSPAALASALMKVSDGLVATPKQDLRAAALHDAFHLLPAARTRQYGLPGTHPPLRARIERLQRLERSRHA